MRYGRGSSSPPGSSPAAVRSSTLMVPVWSAVGGKNFFKEGKGIPAPLELVRWAGHGGWEAGCRDVLALSKMNWNNDALYDSLPVTMGYAQVLAQVVSRMTDLASHPYQLRFFM